MAQEVVQNLPKDCPLNSLILDFYELPFIFIVCIFCDIRHQSDVQMFFTALFYVYNRLIHHDPGKAANFQE